ncbi:hypothetical protein PFLUV_G00204610 [Perca fluviatilis]|uniref:Uncharacterized protein n=1 Tax=Perca fluviatilis TaxID=8168 RepID=A0A6A5DUH2_PERFL|nr:hypothetical protein PFLUV_G00204610 [Perca fluviatilis]
MWTPREALSVATCSVNKCDYIYFVHSYDDRRMIGRLDPGWADDVTLALKTLVFLSPDYNQLNLDLLTVCHVPLKCIDGKWISTQTARGRAEESSVVPSRLSPLPK